MPDTRSFLRLIQSEAGAGDPRMQQTVLMFADWLEERGDVRADWLRQLRIIPGETKPYNGRWTVDPRPSDSSHSWYPTEAAALQELARRVMEAMTRPCNGCDGDGVYLDGLAMRRKCPTCYGDGWLLGAV